LNYTGLRKIVKKFLKKTCKAADASGAQPNGRPLREELRGLLDAIPDAPACVNRISLGTLNGRNSGEHRSRRAETAAAASSSAASPAAGDPAAAADDDDSTVTTVTAVTNASPRRARSHIPLPASPSRERFRVTAESTESDIRDRLRALPFTIGAELVELTEELEKAYATALDLDDDAATETPEDVRRLARRRLRLHERPAPPAADWASAYGSGISTCAVLAVALIWLRPAPDFQKENLEYFIACVPAFRLTAIPILWLWCWAGVTRACTTHYVNYRFIMEVSRSEEAGWHWNAALAATLTAAWLSCFALFSAKVRHGVDPFGSDSASAYYPLGLLVFVILLLTVPPSSIFAMQKQRSHGGIRPGSTRETDGTLRKGLRKTFSSMTRIFNPYARASLLRSIAHGVSAPFGGPVRFRDNLVADVGCSMVRCLVDFETTARFFLTGEYEQQRPSLKRDRGPTSPIITCLPYWFRLQQCVRRFYDAKRGSNERTEHVINAGKYCVSLVAICLASAGGYTTIHAMSAKRDVGEITWLFFLCLGTVYAYAWDIIMDWGFVEIRFAKTRGCFPVVRWAETRDRVFRAKTFYAWAAASNFFGRLAWAVTVTPHGVGANFASRFFFKEQISRASLDELSSETIGTFVAIVELLRRAQWTFLRLENEYLNNAARYRSVVAAPMLLDDVGSSSWDAEWRFEREESDKNVKTGSVYLVVAANALIAAGVAGVFYAVYSK
jgi:hypothetical protein